MGIRTTKIPLPLLLGQTLALFALTVSLTLVFLLSRGLALAFLFSTLALNLALFLDALTLFLGTLTLTLSFALAFGIADLACREPREDDDDESDDELPRDLPPDVPPLDPPVPPRPPPPPPPLRLNSSSDTTNDAESMTSRASNATPFLLSAVARSLVGNALMPDAMASTPRIVVVSFMVKS